MSDSLNAHAVLHKLAQALPQKHHGSIIIVGSLSAAAQLIWSAHTELSTKDIDGMLAPNATAVIVAREIATTLINEGWADTDRNPLAKDLLYPQPIQIINLRSPK